MMNNKMKKVLAEPRVFTIEGVDVKIKPLDFEDTMRLMSLKKLSNGDVDTSDKDSVDILKFVMVKKLKQSLTEETEKGEKLVPSDEEINEVPMSFNTKYMKCLFGMVSDLEGEVKKK